MVPQWVIEHKRDGGELSEADIRAFIGGYTRGDIPDYQMAALAMAIYFQGMSVEETAVLTDAMMRSGDLVDTAAVTLPKADKHSTGGIGDKVSLVLAPLAACCGVAVPMVSGRGLGITGGTLDKFEAIPGYRTDLTEAEFLEVLQACGCSVIGQTGRIAPADKKLYALRDVTATVPSIPLITASIMSKKLAEGIDALVLDVKCGSGAFMKTEDDARALALSLVRVGRCMDKNMGALLTDMNQPLGRAAGNALEVLEALDALEGRGPEDLMTVTLTLTARMLVLTGRAGDEEAALETARACIDSGQALERFGCMVGLHGGDPGIVEHRERLPAAEMREAIEAQEQGYVARVDAETVGRACILLGAGRRCTDDRIDPAVGVADLVKIGEQVARGSLLATVHANDRGRLEEARALLQHAFAVSAEPPEPRPLILASAAGGDSGETT